MFSYKQGAAIVHSTQCTTIYKNKTKDTIHVVTTNVLIRQFALIKLIIKWTINFKYLLKQLVYLFFLLVDL